MEYRQFGQTDLTASAIGFGTWPIGGARYGTSDDTDAEYAIHAALEAGITCFDTAPSYGNGHAEEILGRTLGGRRQEVVIVSKGGLIWDEESHVLGRDSRRNRLVQLIDDSLARLRTDYLDLYLIHWPDLETPFGETMDALETLVHTGKTRYIGVSNFTGEQVRASVAILRTIPLAANQIGFNLFDRRWAASTFATCMDLGVGVMAYGPLAHGLLTGSFTTDMNFDAMDWRASGMIFGQPLLTPGNFAHNLTVVERLRTIGVAMGRTLPQLALAWVLSHPVVTTALVGARNAHEIRDGAGAADIHLSRDELAAIDTMMQDAMGMTDMLPL